MKIKTKDLRLAELRYYDEEHKGVELTGALSYAILLKKGNTYINLFNVDEEFPIFERSWQTNDYHGESYGNKMKVVSDIDTVKSGPCYIIENTDFRSGFDCNFVDASVVEDFMLNSNLYFKDRSEIAEDRICKFRNPIKMYRILLKDRVSEMKMADFFEQRLMPTETLNFVKQKRK